MLATPVHQRDPVELRCDLRADGWARCDYSIAVQRTSQGEYPPLAAPR